MKFSKLKPFLIGCVVLGAATLIVLGMGHLKPETEKEESTQPPLVVRVTDAKLKEQTVFASFQGDVRARTDIELVTQVTGKVMSVSSKFIEGGEFKAGETLLQIDDADYKMALKSAQASVASAQVELEVERATAANRAQEWRNLQGKPIEQANPLLLNKPQIDRAKARLEAAKAELAAAKLNYERTKISAPFDGRIMTKSAELGQFMQRGASIGRVFATAAMEVRIPMSDVQMSELGLTLGYSIEANGSDVISATVSTIFGDQKCHWQGFIKSVDASVDSQTRLLFATVVVDKPFEQIGDQFIPLVPGLFVDVELSSPNKLSGLEFPREALRNGNQVYVYADQKLTFKPVKVIYTSQEKVIVAQDSSDISIGESIITSSVPGAYQGMPVKTAAEQDSLTKDAIVEQSNLIDINETVASPVPRAQPSVERETMADDEMNNDLEGSLSESNRSTELSATNG